MEELYYEKTIKEILRVLDRTMGKSEEINRIIEMAWEDRTPFEAIEYQFGLKENDVRKIMRKELKPSSFKLWRDRKSTRLNSSHRT